MDHQDTFPCKGICRLRILFGQITHHMEGGAAGSHPLSAGIGQNFIFRKIRKLLPVQTELDLHVESPGLGFV